MNKEKESVTFGISFPEPISEKEITKNIREVSTYLNYYYFQKFSLNFLVLFLIHKRIEPDFNDYKNFELIICNGLVSEWSIVFENNTLILAIPKEFFNNSDFKLIEAYYNCEYLDYGALVTIPFSRIKGFKCTT